jgi:hypothetical protein
LGEVTRVAVQFLRILPRMQRRCFVREAHPYHLFRFCSECGRMLDGFERNYPLRIRVQCSSCSENWSEVVCWL